MTKKSRAKVIVVLGPNASGKTKLGVKLASHFNGEIISADSRQVYRGMDIGTGKDLADYRLQIPKSKNQITNKLQISIRQLADKFQTRRIPYHLIDVVNPKTEFNVAKWLKLAKKAIEAIVKRGKVPFVVGGTGLYISALVLGYNLAGTKPNKDLRKKLDATPRPQLLKRLKKLDPITYKKIDKKNKRRVVRAVEVCLSRREATRGDEEENIYSLLHQDRGQPKYNFLLLGVKRKREKINELIDRRVDERLKQGMIAEVTRLHKQGVSWKRLDGFGLEYRWISRYLRGELTREEMTEKLKIAIHQFAKRQMTWFRKMKGVRWVENYSDVLKIVRRWLHG